jgi:hypothetical protein
MRSRVRAGGCAGRRIGPRLAGYGAILIAALGLAGPARASQLIPRSLAELATGSDLIFVARCEAVTPHWNAAHTLIFTANQFRVTRALKGAPGDTITLDEAGGTVGDQRLEVPAVPRFTVGETVLLCVHRTELGRWETYGAAQGKFAVTADRVGQLWVNSGRYQRELTALAPDRRGPGVPLAVLAGHMQAALKTKAAP